VLCLGQALADPAITGQAVSRAFDKGEWNGVWHCKIRKAPAVLQMPKQFCVVAQKIPLVTEIPWRALKIYTLRFACVRNYYRQKKMSSQKAL